MTPPAPRRTWVLAAWRQLTRVLGPLAGYILSQRTKRGKEDPARRDERLGIASVPCPDGKLLWLHGASVGESLSLLPLISHIRAAAPSTQMLLTTGTVTSANLIATRLPEGVIHQYAPVDQYGAVTSFFDHWRPDAAIFADSELWPVLLGTAQKRGVPLALVNGRLSPKSHERWQRRPAIAAELLSAFSVVTAQDLPNAERLQSLTSRLVRQPGNLKRAAPPLAAKPKDLAAMARAIGDRPVLLAASTHPGEEQKIAALHRRLAEQHDRLLTIIVPRHPERGDEIAALLAEAGPSVPRRSTGGLPAAAAGLYIADTLGELGLFYRLSTIAIIGGSFADIGGHNPFEPAQLGCAIVTGPHTYNFDESFSSLIAAGGAIRAADEAGLATACARLLANAEHRRALAASAGEWAETGAKDVMMAYVSALAPVLMAITPGDDR